MEVAEAYSLITRAIETGHAAHGYLIVGDIEQSARVLTEQILTYLFPDAAHQAETHTHPDIAWLEPEGAKRIIRVGSMRDAIIAPLSLASYSGGWKVGVIVGADRMEAPSANAFLKSLEEPTAQTLYLLLTDQPNAMLPTIVSRVQRVDLSEPPAVLTDEDFDFVRTAYRDKDAAALAAHLDAAKEELGTAAFSFYRKRFFRTLLVFAREPMVQGSLPLHQAFGNIEAVEDAFRMCEKSMGAEMVLSYMFDRITQP